MIALDCSEEIKTIIAEKLGIDIHKIPAHIDFEKDLGVDSLDLIEVIWEVEKKFKISIPDEQIEKFVTVGALINYIEERVG